MEKGKFNIITHMIVSIMLAITLVISTAFAWYTSNKDVEAKGNAAVASNNLDVYKYKVFKEAIVDNPYPAPDPDLPQGLINGESIYLSITIKYAASDLGNKNLRFILKDIDGGDFFFDIENNKYYTNSEGKKYNMCDLYTINFHSSWYTNEDLSYKKIKDSTGALNIPFNRVDVNGEQQTKISQLEVFTYENWDTSTEEELTIVFEMKFNTKILDELNIPADVAATKNMSFGQIIIIAEDSE